MSHVRTADHIAQVVALALHHARNITTMAARPRFSGTAEELSIVLSPFVKTAGWLSYGEKKDSPLQVPVLIAHKSLIQALTHVCHNLAFTKETVTGAFFNIAAEKKFSVLSTQALTTEWCDSMTAQLRTVCRHVAHARVQKKTPKWLEHLDGLQGQDRTAAAGSLGTEHSTADSAALEDRQHGELNPHAEDGQEVPHSNLDLATSTDSVIVLLCEC